MFPPTPPLSIAPMMDRTDRHYRFMMRQITRRTLLYTEMVTTGALLRGPRARLLAYDPQEHPIALQLGGDDPDALRQCARIAEDEGYDEVNINIGCPSSRVQSGNFGVCLMGDPDRVAEGVAAMKAEVRIPITVKHRIGFDEQDSYEHMLTFVDRVAQAGADRFTVHARKAWLKGLSPKENRRVPPLRYGDVYRLKIERPHLPIEINGGITTLDEVEAHLQHVDAVMIGRGAWDDPMSLGEADARIFGDAPRTIDRAAVVHAMAEYTAQRLADPADPGFALRHVVKPLMGLYSGQPGARTWRRTLTEGAQAPDTSPTLLTSAIPF